MIAVTGATGHIGNVLVRELCGMGVQVRAILPPYESAHPINDTKALIVRADIRDVQSLNRAFEGCETVYHLAGYISIMPFKKKKLFDINVIGTRNVINACIYNKVDKLIYTSSVHAFSEPQEGRVIDEKTPFDPEKVVGNYAKTKALATLEVLEASTKGLIKAMVLCPSGVIGPYDHRVSEMGELMVRYAAKRMHTYIKGGYDFVDVRDVVQGLINAEKKFKNGEVFILSGYKITVDELLDKLEEITGIKRPKRYIGKTMAYVASLFSCSYYWLTKTKALLTPYSLYTLNSNSNISNFKARRQLGFSPRSLEQSIKDSVGWFRQNRKG